MTWITKELKDLERDARSQLEKEFVSSKITSSIFIADKDELQQAVIDELVQLSYSKVTITKIRETYLPFIIGKYFKQTNEIWLLHGKGDNIDTLIHEMLHSIQNCEPNREGIVDFLTYKITGNSEYIDSFELKDWLEIERNASYNKIKIRLTTEGDCEDF